MEDPVLVQPVPLSLLLCFDTSPSRCHPCKNCHSGQLYESAINVGYPRMVGYPQQKKMLGTSHPLFVGCTLHTSKPGGSRSAEFHSFGLVKDHSHPAMGEPRIRVTNLVHGHPGGTHDCWSLCTIKYEPL